MRKHELECMRLASDCMQLAGDVDRPALRSHFIRMARVWTTLADRDPSADTQTKHWTKRVYPAHAWTSRRQAPVLQYETRQRRNVVNSIQTRSLGPSHHSKATGQSLLHKPHFTSTSTTTLCRNLKKLMRSAIG